ncbi:DNA methyltransferase [Salicola phage CGphi29]|uniref:DNA methyltransferase n=1 Tax=Salicola phage CGphi29 TaxID=754067 RepID=UPI0002C0A1D5|nr:DNA methyltransferase [Salicola phage CGphi29]AGH31797.1 DNA methylase [Salicola phage CGphi29]
MSEYKVLIGDCLESMDGMDDKSVNCCVTSPPYFGLRDYGQYGQLGLEASPDEFVEALVRVFREVRRVLRDDGTVWLNLGDSYASQGGNHSGRNDQKGVGANRVVKEGHSDSGSRSAPNGLKAKDLIGIPWRVAFALQADGWYLRQDIIWHKPNPMPESVRDRCTKAHEYIFLLSKSPKYYYDHEASKETANPKNHRKSAGIRRTAPGSARHGGPASGERNYTTRNRRSVWTVNSRPYKGAHFATFPPDLIEPCILAGCPENGTVLDPFGGSGTTAGVAVANNRKAVICELSEDYAELIPDRVESIAGRQPSFIFDSPQLKVNKYKGSE